mgnify:CR=1 FL=1
MINYSTYMWKSPLDETAKEQAYAKNQVTKVMSFDDFVKHISDHNGVFTRGTVKGVVSDTCMPSGTIAERLQSTIRRTRNL